MHHQVAFGVDINAGVLGVLSGILALKASKEQNKALASRKYMLPNSQRQ